MGLSAIGYEPHPIFAKIARAKLPSANAILELDLIEETLHQGLKHPQPVAILPKAPQTFLCKLFSESNLQQLLGTRKALQEANLARNDLAFLVLSKVLDKCTHSQTDGIYKAPTSAKTPVDPVNACNDTVATIRTDLAELQPTSYAALAQIYESPSQKMQHVPDQSVSIVVTSPPYLNNFDYAEMTRMYLYFWELATSWGDITTKVRSRLITNTTTALKGHKDKQQAYRSNISPHILPDLDELVAALREMRHQKPGKKEYDYLVYPYFSQMTDVLRECFRCMKHGAPIHIMVADAALYGVHISTPQFLKEILEDIGFGHAQCTFVRRRGHRWVLSKRQGSKVGLGEYHVTAARG